MEDLLDEDVDVLSLILIACRARDEVGRFGFFAKPRQAASVIGLFLSDGSFEDKLRDRGMPASAHEWRYLSCAKYWLQVARVAGSMFRDGQERTVAGLTVLETKMVLLAWNNVLVEVADKVLEVRVTFMRMAVDSGPAAAKAAIEEVELAAQIQDYGDDTMARVRSEYKTAFLRANMKEAAKAQATKKFAEGAGAAASSGP